MVLTRPGYLDTPARRARDIEERVFKSSLCAELATRMAKRPRLGRSDIRSALEASVRAVQQYRTTQGYRLRITEAKE